MKQAKKIYKNFLNSMTNWDYEFYRKYLVGFSVLLFSLHFIVNLELIVHQQNYNFLFIKALTVVTLVFFIFLPQKNSFSLSQKLFLELSYTLAFPLSIALWSETLNSDNYIIWALGSLTMSMVYGIISQPLLGISSSLLIYGITTILYNNNNSYPYPIEMVYCFVIGVQILSIFIRSIMIGGLRSNVDLKIQSSKLESLGHMAGGICHEINSPMMVIMGNVQLLEAYLEMLGVKNKKLENSLSRISQQTERIKKIISNLNIYSEKSIIKLEDEKRLSEIIHNVRSDFRDILKEKNIILHLPDIEEKILNEVSYSESVMKQSLSNLIQNSIDALETEQENKAISIDVRKVKGKLVLSVTDTGKGIDKEVESKIMDPFFTTKKIGDGVGLGLNVVQGLVNSIEGEVYHDKDSPQTKFVIELKAS